MPSRRLIALLVVAAVALAAIVAAGPLGFGASGDGRPAAPVAVAGPSGAAPAGGPAVTPTPAEAGGAVAPAEATTLEAVRAVKRFCDLVDDRRLGAAARLLAGDWVWPRRELLPIARLRLASARVQEAALEGQVVLLVRVRARLRGPSPLHDGVNTLFFTLGRDGTTGGWLITAVTSSP